MCARGNGVDDASEEESNPPYPPYPEEELASVVEEENQNWRYVSSLLARTGGIEAETARGTDSTEC